MRNGYVIGASVVALSAALGTAQAVPPGAPRVLTINIADYNAGQVKTAGDIVTVPSGVATYAVNSGTLEINSRFTVTLPANFTFDSQPSLSNTGATSFTLLAGGIGAQTATFVVGPAPLVPGQSATLNSFAIQGVTALETPIPLAAALQLKVQSTNNAAIGNNDPVALAGGAFASEPGAAAIFVGAIQFIDLAPPTLGTLFGTDPATDSATAVLSAIEINSEVAVPNAPVPVLGATGVLNVISTTDTTTVTVSGLFNGIKSAFVSTTSDCQSPTTGTGGSVTPTQLTLTGVPVVTEQFFCVTATGTTLLQQNLMGVNPTITPGTSTDFEGAVVDTEFPGLFTFFGGGIISVTNFLAGDDSGYSSLLRVNNAAVAPITAFALVQPDTGGPMLSGLLGTLGAGVSTVFTEPQLEAAVPGLRLANSGQRATVSLIISGDFGDVSAASLLVNPSGVVTEVGEQPNQPPG